MTHRLAAELIGTFWLVLGGCGRAVFSAKTLTEGAATGIGILGVALAFGLTVLSGVYAFGTISGGHFNPAVTLGAALPRSCCMSAERERQPPVVDPVVWKTTRRPISTQWSANRS